MKIKNFNKRLENLKSERSSFINQWMELSDYFIPNRGRWLVADRNKGRKRTRKLNTITPTQSAITLGSGMLAGITSPSRPWFQLECSDPTLNEYGPVKNWLHDVQSIMYKVFAVSDIYTKLHQMYTELGTFGTAAIGVFPNFDNVILPRQYTIGSYYVSNGPDGRVNTFYAEYQLTVAQVVAEFGIENVSDTVSRMYEAGKTEEYVTIVHACEPNDDRDSMSPLARHKKFRSVYYERDGVPGGDSDKFLRVSGFDKFPYMVPRWDSTYEDTYGTMCPGMIALPENKALQLTVKRRAEAVDKVSAPPLVAPATLTESGVNAEPNKITFVQNPDIERIHSIYGNDYRPDIGAIESVIQNQQQIISKAYFEDLFMMLANSDRRQITAREVAERHEEKLLMLGPVLERVNGELLNPLIDITFEHLQNAGVLPPPPEELTANGNQLSVQYISILAQAQRMVSTSGIERLSQFVMGIGQMFPDALDKFDAVQSVDEYAKALGVNPRVIRGDEEVEQIAAQRAQAQAAESQMDNVASMIDGAQTMSQTNMNGENALTESLRNAGLM